MRAELAELVARDQYELTDLKVRLDLTALGKLAPDEARSLVSQLLSLERLKS